MNKHIYNGNEVLNNSYSESTKSLIIDDGLSTSDYYTMSETYNIESDGYLRMLLKTTNDSIKFVVSINSELKTRYKSYSNATITANGTLIPTFCRDLEIIPSHDFKIYQTPTYTSGIRRANDFIGANTPQVRLGGSSIGTIDTRIPSNSHLIMEFQNVGNSTSDIDVVVNYIIEKER